MDSIFENEVADRFLKLGWDKDEVDSILGVVHEFSGDPDVKRISVYGSMARGTQDDESDIDIGVETPKPNFFKREDRRVNTSNGQGRDIQINIFPFGFDEEHSRSSNKDIRYLARERVRDRIVLYVK